MFTATFTKTITLLAIAATIAAAEVKFIPVPKFPSTDEQLTAYRAIMGGPVASFASQRVIADTIPAFGPTTKPWRDNATIWQPERAEFSYLVCCDGEFTLKVRSRQSDAGTVTTDAEGITALEGIFDRATIAFYNRRFLGSGGREFARIPRPVRITLPRDEAGRLNILNPPNAIDIKWPINDPSSAALRFGPSGVEAFNHLDYDREYPLVTGRLSDEELLDAVRTILASGLDLAGKVRAIRLATQ